MRRGNSCLSLIGALVFFALPFAHVQAGPPPVCAGDCNANQSVTIDELLLAVRIALGDLPPARCEALDLHGDAELTVDEIVAAVANSLSGCGLRIALGTAEGHREDVVEIGIELRTLGREIVRIEDLTFTFDGAELAFVGCSSAIAGKDVEFSAPRQIVTLSLSGDTKPIPNGTFARCRFRIERGAAPGNTPLVYVSARLFDLTGSPVETGGLDGEVVVEIPTPTPSPTETPTPTSTVTMTSTATPTPSFTPGLNIDVTGACRQPGPIGLVPCRDDRIVVSACRPADCHDPECVEEPAACLRDPARRTVVGEGRTGQDGAFSIAIPEEVEDDPLLFEAEVAPGAVYRTIAFGVPDAPEGGAGPPIVADPNSEGTISLLSRAPQPCDPGGSGPTVACEPLLENTTDEAVQGLIAAVRVASGGDSGYAGLDAAVAIGVARARVIGEAGVGIEQVLLRASDGTIYQVVAAAGAAHTSGSSEGETFQVTTLAAAASSPVESCVALPAQASGSLSAVSGAPSQPPALLPLSSMSRTSVLEVPSMRILLGDDSFDPAGSGRITVTTKDATLDVCADASDCRGAANPAAVFGMSAADSRVPAACAARGIENECAGDVLDGVAFGLPSTQNCSTSPTFATNACSVPPPDGFVLVTGEAIVFIHRGVEPGSAFSAGVGGFEIDRDAASPLGCAASTVVSAGARVGSLDGDR